MHTFGKYAAIAYSHKTDMPRYRAPGHVAFKKIHRL